MRALMLAAGVGRRLYGADHESQPPKVLLTFGGKSLLQRHIEILAGLGFSELVMVLGHRQDEILAEARRHAPEGFVRSVFNPRYREGPVISLWTAREILRGNEDVVFMDADVLYPPLLMERLVRSPHANCFIMDRNFEAGDEPVNLCLKDGHPVEFGKKIPGTFDVRGEWPGFLKLSPRVAALLADATETYMAAGDFERPYEPAMRDVLLAEPKGTFGVEDITGISWIEIDFPADVLRAEKNVLPRLSEKIDAIVDAGTGAKKSTGAA